MIVINILEIILLLIFWHIYKCNITSIKKFFKDIWKKEIKVKILIVFVISLIPLIIIYIYISFLHYIHGWSSGTTDGWLGMIGTYFGAILAISGVYWQVNKEKDYDISLEFRKECLNLSDDLESKSIEITNFSDKLKDSIDELDISDEKSKEKFYQFIIKRFNDFYNNRNFEQKRINRILDSHIINDKLINIDSVESINKKIIELKEGNLSDGDYIIMELYTIYKGDKNDLIGTTQDAISNLKNLSIEYGKLSNSLDKVADEITK